MDIKEKDGAIVTCRLLDVCKANDRAVCTHKFMGYEKVTRLVRTTVSILDP